MSAPLIGELTPPAEATFTVSQVIYDLEDISPETMAYLEKTLDWEWLCKHFTDPEFVKKSVTGQKARALKTLLHHFGSKPFSYRLEARCQGSKFPEIDMFKDVYATMVEKSIAVLQKATSQLPPETPIENIMVPEDVGFQIMIDVLDQNFGRCRGKIVRGMGKARIRETGASSSRSNTAEVDALKEEVTTLKVQLAIQEEQMRAQGEQMRAQVMAQSE
ncbi:hypothetical protein D8674_011824 [Pyrus ussuriensis x Pyrus communis]|uniref:Uncharacterized protein n=1 Tax=Pyrus ussuriensis x Pyrus communis TaxID=2448454 RepID=A0A5N5FZX1_9ROSA|nr:hypothetical protein D8674_011824 [Pyrus ussuriensis x Pyrus communis]